MESRKRKVRLHTRLTILIVGCLPALLQGQTTWVACGSGGPQLCTTTNSVGVGTTAPANKLTISGGGFNSVDLAVNGRIQTGDSNGAGGVWLDSADSKFIGQDGSFGVGIYSSGSWILTSQPNGGVTIGSAYSNSVTAPTNGLVVSGSVGIGTRTPAAILNVQADAAGLNSNWTIGQLVISGNADPNRRLVAGYDTSSNNGFIQAGDAYVAYEPLVINPAGGNVGIGLTNPPYTLSVKGQIGAGEVVVTSTSGWSDYVFDPGYQLAPLKDVAAYVKENHHLPEIPSAKEVEEKGVSLGEMQSKLLAKIEELTLHMVKAEERNDRLEQQNRELNERIRRLEEDRSKVQRAADRGVK